MALDKNKIVAEASKHVQKGQHDKAIKLYEKILAEDPKDVRVRLKIAETQQKKNDLAAAAETFHQCAQAYGEQGFALKAVAVYKQIARLTPDDPRVPERLAALYQQLGLLSDAMGQMHALAQAWERAGDEGKVVEVLQRMAELDPENVATAVKLGELLVRGGQPGPALEQFRRAAAVLKKTPRVDEYLKVAERVASLAPQDLQLTRELANVYLARGDTKRALAKLQLCFKADPKDVETLTLLAQAFRDLGQLSKTLSVYKELAHVYGERGRAEEARATFRKVLDLAPDDLEAQEGAGLRQRAPEPPAAAAPGFAAPSSGGAPSPSPAEPARSAGSLPGAEAIPRLLTELDVYLKYGLTTRALEHVHKILAIDPDHPEAHERARELHARAGDPASAAREGALAVRGHLARGRPAEADAALARLRELAPEHPELAELAAACAPAGGPPEPAAAGEEVIAFEEGEAIALEPGEPLAADGGEAIDFGPGEALATEDGEAIAFDDGEALEVGEADVELLDEDALALSLAAEEGEEVIVEEDELPFPAELAPEAEPAGPGIALEPHPGEEVEIAEAAPEPASAEDLHADEGGYALPVEVDGDLAADEARSELPVEMDGDLPAAAAAIALGPAGEAVAPRAGAPAGQVGAQAHPAGQPSPAGAHPELAPHAVAPLPVAEGDETFDLGKELASELEGEAPPPAPAEFQYSVDDVFAQFKKGVEQTVRPEDGATHYDLGIAYKEMGLLDDAVKEFEVALSAGAHDELDCLTLIGLCRMAQGLPLQAADAFRRALGSDGLGAEAAKALHYELGLAYEAAGDAEAALFYLQKIVRVDPRYREVSAAVARLGGGPGRPPASLIAPRAGDAAAAPAPSPARPRSPAAAPPPAATSPSAPPPVPASPSPAGATRAAAPPPSPAPATPSPAPGAPDGGRRPGPRKKIGYV